MTKARDIASLASVSAEVKGFADSLALPSTDGTANQVLQTDGAGNLTFSTISNDPTTTVTTIGTVEASKVVTASADSTVNFPADKHLRFDTNGLDMWSDNSYDGHIECGSQLYIYGSTSLNLRRGTESFSNMAFQTNMNGVWIGNGFGDTVLKLTGSGLDVSYGALTVGGVALENGHNLSKIMALADLVG
jgi:hypothetical protein